MKSKLIRAAALIAGLVCGACAWLLWKRLHGVI